MRSLHLVLNKLRRDARTKEKVPGKKTGPAGPSGAKLAGKMAPKRRRKLV